MLKKLVIAAALSATIAGTASAAPIMGSFSLVSFGGTFIGGATPTAATATGLDFGAVFSGTGNGYGTNGTALVGIADGDFTGLSNTTASVADISLGALANPFATNPFISFGTNSPIQLNFTDAAYTRSPLGTGITITGAATFTNGVPADTTLGQFSLSLSSQSGSPSSANFTFTSNASAGAVPEPASWAMMVVGFGLLGSSMRRRKPTTSVSFG